MQAWFGTSMVGQWAAFLMLGALGLGGAVGGWWLGVKMNAAEWKGDNPYRGQNSGEGVALMGFFALGCALFVVFGWIPWGIWLVKRSFGWE